MSSFDYNAPAELFLAKPAKGCRTKYRRFATAAEALRFAVEDLRMPKAFGAWLEVGDERFSSSESNASMKTIRCGSLSDRRPNARAMMHAPPDCGRPHGHCDLAAEPGPREVRGGILRADSVSAKRPP